MKAADPIAPGSLPLARLRLPSRCRFNLSAALRIVPVLALALSIQGATTVTNLEITAGNSVSVLDGQTFVFDATLGTSTLSGPGSLNLFGSYYGTTLRVSGGELVITPTGLILLSNFSGNILTGATSSNKITNQGTIQGSGNLGASLIGLANSGQIIANQSVAFNIAPGSAGMLNTGTLRATSGGTLTLNTGTLTNFQATTQGSIVADADSRVSLNGVNILGGILSSSGTGRFRIASTSTLDGVQFASGSLLEIPDGNQINLANFISNSGTINSLGSYYGTTIYLTGTDFSLSGGGVFSLSNFSNNQLTGTSTTRLINIDNTITGSGNIGANQIGLVNRGTIAASGSQGLTIDPGPLGALNPGLARATSGSTLTIAAGIFTQLEGTKTGTVRAEGGGVVQFSSATASQGTVEVVDNGEIRLASSQISTFALNNSYAGIIRTSSGTSFLDQFALSNPSGGLVRIIDGTTLEIAPSAALINAGIFKLDSSYYGATLTLKGDAEFSGGGTVQLSNHGGNTIRASSDGIRLTNTNNTLQGSGNLGANLLAITNRGTIRANQQTALIIDPGTLPMINSGTLEASNGASLTLAGGTYTNYEAATQGLITAAVDSVVKFENASVFGGKLSSFDTGRLRVTAHSTLIDITLLQGSVFEIPDGQTLGFSGAIVNQGTFSALGSYYGTSIAVPTGQTSFSGGGTFQLSNFSNNTFTGPADATLVNNDNLFIGSGNIGAGAIGFVNLGTVTASGSQGLTVQPGQLGASNSGLLNAASGGFLTLRGNTFTNSWFGKGGTIRAESGGVVKMISTSVDGGLLAILGSGEVRLESSTLSNLQFSNSTTGVMRAVSGTSTLNHVQVDNPLGGTIVIDDGSNLVLKGNGTYLNSGTLRLNGSYYGTFLGISDGDVVLSGTGNVLLSNFSGNNIGGGIATDRLVNQDNTLHGSGNLGSNQIGIVNRGIIRADQSVPLIVNPSATGIINSGLMEAAGGTLRITDGTLTNFEGASTGQLFANSSPIELSNLTVLGGLFSSYGAGKIVITGSTSLANVTISSDSTLWQNDGTGVTLSGSLTNQGTFQIASSYYGTTLTISGEVQLTGGGSLVLSNHSGNLVTGSTGTVLNNVNQTISGAGTIGNGGLSLVNTGTIHADSSTPLYLNPATAFTNQGTVLVTGAGGLRYQQGTLINAGQMDISSKLTAAGTFTHSAGFLTLSGGTLAASSITLADRSLVAGFGAFQGPVNSNAIILVGGPAQTGQLSFNSTISLGSLSLLCFELGVNGASDRLVGGTQISLAGGLSVSLLPDVINSIHPTDTYILITGASLSGTFADLPASSRLLTADGLASFRVNYNTTSFTLTDFQLVPEPPAWILLSLGSILLIAFRRHRKT